jgi:hypothetical protein
MSNTYTLKHISNNNAINIVKDIDNDGKLKIDKEKTKDKIKNNVSEKIEEKVEKKVKELEHKKVKDDRPYIEILKEKDTVNLGQLGKYSYLQVFLFCINLLVFPAMAFQMWKTYKRKESSDFNPWFILIQLLGGAPEGMIGAIIGNLLGNTQMLIIGIYAMFYNAFMLFFRLFGKNGSIMSLF